MIAWFARNHVAANLLMATIVFLGLYSLKFTIPLEVFPSTDPTTISTSVSLRGASPEDIETAVAVRIEEAVADLEGIEEISSRSIEGSTTVWMDVEDGYDPDQLLADIKSRVDSINTFPSSIERPVISLAQWRADVISVAVSGDFSEREIRQFGEQVRDDLLAIDGIDQVELDRVRDYEVSVSLRQDKLRQYQLTLAQIAAAIEASSLDLSAGNLRTSGGDILLRTIGQAYQRDEFESIVIKTDSQGSIIRLGDVATVTDGFEETALRTRFNGHPAAMVEVYRTGKQSAIEVAQKVRDYIDERQAGLPQGLEIGYWDDDSEIVKSRIGTLTSNAIQGGALVLLLLTLFLRPTIAFWVFIGIPVCFMGAFLLMPVMGVTLNIVSLFGFILVLGIVVDDAIVTGENIYTHLRHSESGLQAAINGTQEVAVPVTFGILTTVAAFIPMAFIEGQRGAIFANITAVVIPVLLFSLVESKLILPAHLKHLKLRGERKPNLFSRYQQRFADGFENWILRYYQPLLKRCLDYRYAVLALFIGTLLVAITLATSGWMKFTYFPRVPSETARVTLTMPTGTPFEVTDGYVERMVDAALTLQEKYRDPDSGVSVIRHILSTTGSGGGASHQGRVRFETVPPEQRPQQISMRELVNEWRGLIGPIPGAETVAFRAEIGRGSDPVDIQLRGQSLVVLKEVAGQIRQRLAEYPALFDISDNLSDGKQQLSVELTAQGQALGVTRNEIISQVRQAIYGIEVQRIQRGREDVRVMVRLPESERNALSDLQGLLITTPAGGQVPLSHLATLIPGQSPAAIYRIDRFRTANVIADMDKEAVNATALNRELGEYLDQLLQRYPGVSYTLEGEAREQRESFGSLQYGLIFVLFVIYSLLAIPFKSYSQPLIVMSVIPFGAIGAIAGHALLGMNLSIMSLMGLLALIGVVVNDSLVLVDYINQRRQQGKFTLRETILSAGAARFRPVMLTSITTFVGLMPLLFETATQAQFLIPMAISLGFGILFATLITLLMVPINYQILEDIKQLSGAKKPKQPQPSH